MFHPVLYRLGLLAFCLLAAARLEAGTITLAWDPNTEADLAGYHVLYGTRPGTYTVTVDVGRNTTWMIDNLNDGQTYYLAVRAYSSSGMLSPASTEVSGRPAQDGPSAPPFGTIDTPLEGATGLSGSIPITGWALDDRAVTRVAIYREAVGAEPPGTEVFIGNAVQVEGARPDVAAAFPDAPHNQRAGWGYLLLTNMLPNRGNGTFRLNAYAEDAEGQRTRLGSRRITANNAQATKPFGAIDTPAQGETISGTAYVNFGWALTPPPHMIPTAGSTITVFIDGRPVGFVSYDHFRSDIFTLFPEYGNALGAIGHHILDTTTLANGLHTISWRVTDAAGRTDGIGSRYFWIQNPAGAH